VHSATDDNHPTKTFAGSRQCIVICGMEKDVNTTPPPSIDGKAYNWTKLQDVESIMGMAFDEVPVYPSKAERFMFYSYTRLGRNKWFMMHGHEVVIERGKPIIWNDTILKSKMRPDEFTFALSVSFRLSAPVNVIRS